ncbi:MAG: 3-deoxy-manno-octulosonate cytidylyltransferase [Gemmatimonadetes bacterium]|nr:3-deoxy-manno-octulosonate cytidylyltransferase [Gemmatimonadota bacterium]
MKTVAVIPARWGSRRFPGKPVTMIAGRPMIAWVVDAAAAAERVDRLIVATDDDRIAAAAQDAGAEVRMTRSDHATGTDRVAEAVQGIDADVVLNLQGDEPMLRPEAVDRLVGAFGDPTVAMATLGIRGATERERNDPMRAKIAVNDAGDALYFSRAPIPYRNVAAGAPELGPEDRDPDCWKHVGTYGFRREALERFVAEPREGLEALEDLEQLRALRLGWKIRVVEISQTPVCVEVPEDVEVVESLMKRGKEGVGR